MVINFDELVKKTVERKNQHVKELIERLDGTYSKAEEIGKRLSNCLSVTLDFDTRVADVGIALDVLDVYRKENPNYNFKLVDSETIKGEYAGMEVSKKDE